MRCVWVYAFVCLFVLTECMHTCNCVHPFALFYGCEGLQSPKALCCCVLLKSLPSMCLAVGGRPMWIREQHFNSADTCEPRCQRNNVFSVLTTNRHVWMNSCMHACVHTHVCMLEGHTHMDTDTHRHAHTNTRLLIALRRGFSARYMVVDTAMD